MDQTDSAVLRARTLPLLLRSVQTTVDPTSHRPGTGIVRIEGNGPLHCGIGTLHVTAIGDSKRSHRQRRGILFSVLHGMSCELRNCGKATLVFWFGPALSYLHDLRISGKRRRRCIMRVYIERLLSKTDCLRPALFAHVMELSESTKKEIVRIYALGRFERRALDL